MTAESIRIAITPQDITSDEPALVAQALHSGFTYVHLRHPSASMRDMRNLIEAIPANLHHRIKIHGHFDLVHSFNLGGLHLNSRCPVAPVGYVGALSRSCHTIEEVMMARDMVYVTLSPIFDSISKPGYCSAFTPEQLRRLDVVRHTPVIALGGVTPDNVELLCPYNFSGYAVLGALHQFLDNQHK